MAGSTARRWVCAHVAGLTLGAFGLAACSSDGGPFGGPYGGRVKLVGPTDGGLGPANATFTEPPPPPPAGQLGANGTWTHIFHAYLKEGTVGNCTFCHAEMSDPPASFEWLVGHDYVGGASPALTNEGMSCLSWYGGNMPPGMGANEVAAVQEMNTWAASGGLNN